MTYEETLRIGRAWLETAMEEAHRRAMLNLRCNGDVSCCAGSDPSRHLPICLSLPKPPRRKKK